MKEPKERTPRSVARHEANRVANEERHLNNVDLLVRELGTTEGYRRPSKGRRALGRLKVQREAQLEMEARITSLEERLDGPVGGDAA